VRWDWRLRTTAITGLLFIPWVNMSVRAVVVVMLAGDNSWLVYQSCLVVYQQRHLERVGGMDQGMRICIFIIFDTLTDLIHSVESYDMGPPALLPIQRKACCRFLSPLKSIVSAGFEPMNLGSSGKHSNHYISEATKSFGGFYSYNAMPFSCIDCTKYKFPAAILFS
jgi:hypothetical protein